MCYWSSHSTLHQAVNTFFLLVLDTLLPACTETQDQTEDLRTFSFLLLSMCTAMWMCVAFYIPEDNKLFKAPYGHLIPQLFLWNFLVSLLHPPPHTHTPHSQLLPTASDSHTVEQLPIVVFNKYPWRLGFRTRKFQVRWNKDIIVSEVFQETTRQGI